MSGWLAFSSATAGSNDSGESPSASEQAGHDVGSAVETSGLLSAVAAEQETLVSNAGHEIVTVLSGVTTVTQLTQITSGPNRA